MLVRLVVHVGRGIELVLTAVEGLKVLIVLASDRQSVAWSAKVVHDGSDCHARRKGGQGEHRPGELALSQLHLHHLMVKGSDGRQSSARLV